MISIAVRLNNEFSHTFANEPSPKSTKEEFSKTTPVTVFAIYDALNAQSEKLVFSMTKDTLVVFAKKLQCEKLELRTNLNNISSE